MKKLIIMTAILVAGIAANAASFKWSAANVYGVDGTKFTGSAAVYGYLTSDGLLKYTMQTASQRFPSKVGE